MRVPDNNTANNETDSIDDPNPDPRVAYALRAGGIDFNLTPSGDYTVAIGLPTDRGHTTVIRSQTAQVGVREMRCVFACACVSEDPLPADVLQDLLERNAQYHLAAWQVVSDEDSHAAVLSATIPADASAAELVSVVCNIAATADDVEEVLTGRDQF